MTASLAVFIGLSRVLCEVQLPAALLRTAFELGSQCRWNTLSEIGEGLVGDLFRFGLKRMVRRERFLY